jgi:hypothetical protein
MANTITNSLVSDGSSLANFKAWASQISANFAAAAIGLVQTNDIGQVQWTTNSKTLTSITGNGTIWTGSATAHGFRQGQIVSITGTTHFNGDFIIASVSTNAFTITNATQSGVTDTGSFTAAIQGVAYRSDTLPVNALTLNGFSTTGLTSKWREIWSSGTTYAVGDVVWYNDGSGNYSTYISVAASNTNNIPNAATVGSTGGGGGGTKWKVWNYEMWQTNDSGTAVYMRIEYGQVNTSVPGIALQWGTADSGTADIYASGNFTNREVIGSSSASAGGATTFTCNFCGDGAGGGFNAYMWRTATTTIQEMFFGFERSRDNSGAKTNTFITYVVAGGAANSGTASWKQCSLFLTGTPSMGVRHSGCATIQSSSGNQQAPSIGSSSSWQVGNNIPAAPILPSVGYFANPLLMLVAVNPNDIADGAAFTITLYGATHTYLCAINIANGAFHQINSNAGGQTTATGLVPAMRWE